MTTKKVPSLSIAELTAQAMLPAEFQQHFHSRCLSATAIQPLLDDFTTLLPTTQTLYHSQRHYFAIVTYTAGIDDRLRNYCHAALNLSEEEWDTFAQNHQVSVGAGDAIAAMHTARLALFPTEY